MKTERPDIPVLTVAWLNHRMRELAEEQKNAVPEEIYLDEPTDKFFRSVKANISQLTGMVMDVIVKPAATRIFNPRL